MGRKLTAPPRKEQTAQDVLEAALRLFTYRPRSEEEARRRLSRRFPPTLVEEALAHLTKRGMLDDAAFARFWRESRERQRPRGESALRWELLRLGVAREVVDEALQGLDEVENAYRAGAGYLRRVGQADYHAFREKLSAHLRRRGFSWASVNEAVQRLWRELSDPSYGDIVCDPHD